MQHTLQERIDRATRLKREGYNCAQCVAMVFDDISPLSDTALASATAALGGGIGGTKGTCGTVTGMAIVDGSLTFDTPANKQAVYAGTRQLVEQFASANGSVLCSDLRQPGKKSCLELIVEAITMLHNRHAQQQ